MQPHHSTSATVDYILASTLVGGAYAFHVDMAVMNQYLAFIGGFFGVILAGARLFFFMKDRFDGRTKVAEDRKE